MHFFLPNRNIRTYDINLRCYLMWVGIYCASTIKSSMRLVLGSLFIMWPTKSTINNVVRVESTKKNPYN